MLYVAGAACGQREGRGRSRYSGLLQSARGAHPAARLARHRQRGEALCGRVRLPRQRLDPLLQPRARREARVQEPEDLHARQAALRRALRSAHRMLFSLDLIVIY